jgi:hypothetical protein
MDTNDRWPDARRIEEWAGEVRVNLIRLAAIVVFYAHHLLNVYLFRDDPTLTGRYNTGVTALVLAWAAAVLVLYFCLARRWVPWWLKYAATGWDLLLITLLLMLTAEPKSWLAVLYLLVIAAAPLRLSLPLVYTATLGAMAAYLVFLGYVKYGLQLSDEQRLSRPNQVIFVLALGATGILAGQVVRQGRRMVRGYPVTVEERQEEPACHSS